MIYGVSKVSICEIMGLSGYSEKSNVQEAYYSKTSISAQLCFDDSIQIPFKLGLGPNV